MESAEQLARELCASSIGSLDPDFKVFAGAPREIITPRGVVQWYADEPKPLWLYFRYQAETLIALGYKLSEDAGETQ